MKKTKATSKLKPIINKKSLEFLSELFNTHSPSGFEYTGQKVWLDYIKPYIDEHFIDNYATVLGNY